MSTRGLRSALLVTGVSVMTVIATATAATAGPAPVDGADPCPSGSLCLYEGSNFTGERFTATSLNPGGICVSLVDHGWGDRAHSAINTHGTSAAMFTNDDCVGGPYLVPANSSLSSLGSFSPESVWVPYQAS
ncbi:peptidase inhibitor family I36 protein [Plantactinospora sp. B6F1]|uniref:peptidase inhibitor family I36 protein n=1 Tax=Plantactinospora sp. B6F1 TaxID=3158971 RepID=UPI0010D52A7A